MSAGARHITGQVSSYKATGNRGSFVLDSGLVKLNSQRIQPSDGSRTIDLPSPKQEWVLTPESFERLLWWLDPERERAGEVYEEIRAALIKRFRQLGSCEPEDLANETFDRVAKKLPEIASTYKGDRVPYFFSVAYYVHKEHSRRPLNVPLDPEADPPDRNVIVDEEDEDEVLNSCLEHCMEKLNASKRHMILRYYRGERNVKIKLRKELAESLGIPLTNLRLKAQRVRVELKKCILDCVERRCTDLEFARRLGARGPITSESGKE